MKNKKLDESKETEVLHGEINHKKLKAVLITTAVVGVLIAVAIILSLIISKFGDDTFGTPTVSVLPSFSEENTAAKDEDEDKIALIGIVYSKETKSYAIISYRSSILTLTENDKIGDSRWILKEIRENEVVLTRSSGDRVLDFSSTINN